MMHILGDQRLTLLSQQTNKALEAALRHATPQQRVELEAQGNLRHLITSLFTEAQSTSRSTTLLLEMLKNSALFKEMGSFTGDLSKLLEHPDAKALPDALRKALEAFRHTLERPDAAQLKKQIEHSGIFLEAKLARAFELGAETVVRDMKAVLLKLSASLPTLMQGSEAGRLVEKMLLQIEYFQLLSYLEQGSALYLPFEWDALEEGHLVIKKGKRTYCDISLQLKEVGAVRLILSLFDKDQITLHLFSDSEAFKERVRGALSLLRGAFASEGLSLAEVRLFEMPKAPHDVEVVSPGFEVRA